MTGAVLSMLMPLTVAAAAGLPASSTHEPVLVLDWPAPSAERVPPTTVLSAGLMPDKASAQLKLTTTSVLFQPLALASGRRLPLMTGAVLSMLIGPKEAVLATLPALSMQDPVFETDAVIPSAVTVCPATVLVASP